MKNHICICYKCLLALESREGIQSVNRIINFDDMFDEIRPCDLCGSKNEDTLYEI